jgi:hypothetical protein
VVRRIAIALVVLAALFAALLQLLGSGVLGEPWGAGDPVETALAPAMIEERAAAQRAAAKDAGVATRKQILFGDLHVHTTYSTDAFLMSLPISGGDGARPVSDACDFARHCAALDFWSINDHALASTPESWAETVDSIRQCNAVSKDASNPDVTAFLGWEWTQIGSTPENHYGHKNVILRDLEDGRIPTRPISARGVAGGAGAAIPSAMVRGALALAIPDQTSLDLIRYFRDVAAVPSCPDGVPVRELPLDCRESAATPADLFAKLDDWNVESLVIPHGTSWGFYTPQGSSWDKQLGAQHDPSRQKIVEVYSGHGNSEEFRPWRAVTLNPDGTRACPRPRPDWNYEPSCWRAGEIIRKRCEAEGATPSDCESRAVEARQNYVDADISGHLTVPAARAEEWLDSGQCRDCFQPAFNMRPGNSVQYMMALRNQTERSASPDASAGRFDFGFIASSDNHSARPGTGYKEYARTDMTEARFSDFPDLLVRRPESDYAARSQPFENAEGVRNFFGVRETERQSSFFVTGGLAAVHAEGRDRQAIWDGLQRREVYGTSGPRILLWFDLVNAAADNDALAETLPMGSSTTMQTAPDFRVRAVGSFEQQPGCPDASGTALGPERLDRLCRGECYRPSDRRRRITRIEVIRIRPQNQAGEPVEDLVEDPWRVYQCPPDPQGCAVRFADHEFPQGGRDTLYYVRAIEEPTPGVNAGNLRCRYDGAGVCQDVNLCTGRAGEGDCLQNTQQRAWSSPIFLSFGDGTS